ncbi:MAG: hypothetical protein ACJ79S_05010 [Gemmatimonadaceae bacterium]
MPLPIELLHEMSRRRAEEAVEARRATRRDLAWTALQCVAWVALGLFLIGWSMHTTDPTLGRAAFAAGIGAGNGGWLFTVLAAYRRGEKRGDW